MESLATLPTLGVGLGFREPFLADLFRHRDGIDFLEIVADHYFDSNLYKSRELETLHRQFPLIPHGLSLSLGSAEGVDADYLKSLQGVVARLNPPWWSEHIAFTKSGGKEIGHLTPLPRTRESLDVLVRNIHQVQQEIGGTLILENITEPFLYPIEQLDEASFLGELVDQSQCGLLLDVTNLYTNSVNHRFDPLELLKRLPHDRIVQLHFVGGHWNGNELIDSHSSAAPQEVWDLLDEVLKCSSVKGVILERDENIPPLLELVEELERARRLFAKAYSWKK